MDAMQQQSNSIQSCLIEFAHIESNNTIYTQ